MNSQDPHEPQVPSSPLKGSVSYGDSNPDVFRYVKLLF